MDLAGSNRLNTRQALLMLLLPLEEAQEIEELLKSFRQKCVGEEHNFSIKNGQFGNFSISLFQNF